MNKPDLLKWPQGTPQPSIAHVYEVALRQCGEDPGEEANRAARFKYRKTPGAVIAKRGTYYIARKVLRMSTPEIARAMQCSTHASIVGRGERRDWAHRFIVSAAGQAVVNEILYTLIQAGREELIVKRKQPPTTTLWSDNYRAAARAGLNPKGAGYASEKSEAHQRPQQQAVG